jgi:hypothetical protein
MIEPADLNRDGAVNSIDVSMLLNDWGVAGSPADLDGSGVVDSADIAIVLSRWTT